MEKKFINMWGAYFSRPVAVDSYRWNGWAVPYFGEDDLPELIEFMNEQEFTGAPFSIDLDGVRGVHTDQICCNWEKFASNEYKCSCDCEECREVWGWETLDGARVVSVGGGAWCWSSDSAEELAEEILRWLERDTPTKENFYALLHEETHRTRIEFTEIEFILGCSRWNGWELYEPETFLDCINSSYESAGFYNA
jgi:hypothetical protein